MGKKPSTQGVEYIVRSLIPVALLSLAQLYLLTKCEKQKLLYEILFLRDGVKISDNF